MSLRSRNVDWYRRVALHDRTLSIHADQSTSLVVLLMTNRLVACVCGLAAVAFAAGAIACANTPSAPFSSPTSASTNALEPASANAGVSLASCLGGSADAGCFTGRRLQAASSTASPVTSAPVLNNNQPTLTSGPTVTLTWTASGSPTSYIVEASSSPGGSANLASLNTGNAQTTLTVPRVPPGVYYVRVRAVDSSGPSAPSNEVQVTVGTSGGGACPSAPQNLTNASQSPGTITLSWQMPATGSASSFVIQAGSSPGRSDLANFDTTSTAVTFVARNVPAGSYYVRVYGKNSACSPPSFLGPASNEVLVFAVGASSDVQVTVSWDAMSDVDLHVVEPSGEEIYWGNKNSLTGGVLDVDSNPACLFDNRQIENIGWMRAPAGTYTVRVDYWADCGVSRTNYLVTVRNNGNVATFPGFFTGPGDQGSAMSGVLITTFVHAAPDVAEPLLSLFKTPAPSPPSAEKLRLSRTR